MGETDSCEIKNNAAVSGARTCTSIARDLRYPRYMVLPTSEQHGEDDRDCETPFSAANENRQRSVGAKSQGRTSNIPHSACKSSEFGHSGIILALKFVELFMKLQHPRPWQRYGA